MVYTTTEHNAAGPYKRPRVVSKNTFDSPFYIPPSEYFHSQRPLILPSNPRFHMFLSYPFSLLPEQLANPLYINLSPNHAIQSELTIDLQVEGLQSDVHNLSYRHSPPSIQLMSETFLGSSSLLVYDKTSSWPLYSETSKLEYIFSEQDFELSKRKYKLELVSPIWRALFLATGKFLSLLDSKLSVAHPGSMIFRPDTIYGCPTPCTFVLHQDKQTHPSDI